MYALLEGLAGVEDRLRLFQYVQISPRWVAADVTEAEVQVGYACSGAEIGYAFRHRGDRICLDVLSSESEILFHVLLPENFSVQSVRAGGNDVEFRNRMIEKSPYVDFSAEASGGVTIEIHLK